MNIAGRKIGGEQPPYIVAEISGNHCGDLDRALALIRAAKAAGADAVKFQAYEPDTITIDCDKADFVMHGGPWKGRKLYELYQRAHTPFAWFPDLVGCANDSGITWFSSVFDRSSVDMLERLGCPAYKIASMEIVDIPLIRHAAKTGKPMIISTGMSNQKERSEALQAAAEFLGYLDIAMLGCVSGYPTPIAESDLGQVCELQGISDHSMGWEVPVAATALGVQIIEKHFCFSRNDPIEDAAFSLEPAEFEQMCRLVREIWKGLGLRQAPSEEPQRQARRSLYVVAQIKAGDIFTEQNVRSIRPGYGMAPKELPNVLGCRASCDIEIGTALSQDMIV